MQTPRPDLPRTIGFIGALGIMLGVTIGSGIFRTPASIAASLREPWQVVLVWVIGGVLSLLGALTFAELAAMMPRSGGLYNFLASGLGRAGRPIAFVFGWTYMLITKPLAAGGIALVCTEHLRQLVPFSPLDSIMASLGASPQQAPINSNILVTCGILTLLTLLNLPGLRLGAAIGVVLTSLKVMALAAIVLAALLLRSATVGEASIPAVADLAGVSASGGWRALVAAYTAAMAGVLWTYDGWNDVGSVAGEVREPQRTLPRALIVGTLLIMTLYVAVNLSYMCVLSLGEMAALNEPGKPTVVAVVMERLAGGSAATIVVLMIVLSTLGSSFASVITGARVTFAQARDGLLFSPLAKIHPTWQTPHVALWVQLLFSCLCLVGFQTFERLTGGFTFTMWIFYGLAGASIFVLRSTQPQAERPFRCPGYPIVPALFVLSALLMTVLNIQADWKGSAIWLGILLAGVPVYFVWMARLPVAESQR
jgi:basic amino acid/polyamine antiporter, APA family